jgi:hypothetical protein
MSADAYEAYLSALNEASKPYMAGRLRLEQEMLERLEAESPLRTLLPGKHTPIYTGPDLFDVAPPGVHALLAFRNVHRFTGVLDGTPLAVQE